MNLENSILKNGEIHVMPSVNGKVSNMNTVKSLPAYIFDKETGWRLNLPMSVEQLIGKRVLALYRVSSDKQLYRHENDEADIPMQRERCRGHSELMGWEIVCELQEEGVSGHKVRAENRDKIQLIKEYALQKKFDILLVFMFDRIGRIADETPFVVEWLIANGIRVVSATEGEQRMESHTDRLLNYIRFWQADGESQKTSIRTANSLHILAGKGHFTGGVCPYGYRMVKSDRLNKRKKEVHDLEIFEDEAQVVRLMFHLAYVNGCGAQRVANYLNAHGYKNRSGVNWHPSTIRAILRNVQYIGIVRSGKTSSPPQEHLRIVEDSVFYAVREMQTKRAQNHSTRTVPYNTRGQSLLAGNVFCAHCGARLCLTTCGKGRPRADGTDVRRIRYTCQTKSRKHGECDGQTGYTMSKLDDIIDHVIHGIFSKVKSISRRELVQAQSDQEYLARKNHVQRVRRDLEKAEKDLQRLKDEIVRSLMGDSSFQPEVLSEAIHRQEEKFREIAENLSRAEKDLENTEAIMQDISSRFGDLMTWASIYDKADVAAKKMIVSRIIERVDVHRGYELDITLNIGIEQFLNTIEICA